MEAYRSLREIVNAPAADLEWLDPHTVYAGLDGGVRPLLRRAASTAPGVPARDAGRSLRNDRAALSGRRPTDQKARCKVQHPLSRRDRSARARPEIGSSGDRKSVV